jgi:hypothetical protein
MQREAAEQVAAQQAGEADVVRGAADLAQRHGRSRDRCHAYTVAVMRAAKTTSLRAGRREEH